MHYAYYVTLTVYNPGAVHEKTYSYDNNDNLTSISAPSTPWQSRTYGYDAVNRLIHAEGPYGTIDYTYDSVGNRLTQTTGGSATSYTYYPATNRLHEAVTGAETVTHTFDLNGNITGMSGKILTYNQDNRLIRVEESGLTLGEYIYNGSGQRVIKNAGGVTTVFLYDFDGNIIGESDSSGNISREYLYKGSSRLAMVDVLTGNMYYYGNDKLGTPQIITDSTNTVVWEGEYKPFGEAEVNPNSSVVNNFRFPGQYFDYETGLHYNYHRYYDPMTGRYLTADPIGLDGGINLYAYVSGNPVNLTDHFGLWYFDFNFTGTANGRFGPGGTFGFQIGPSGVNFYYGFGLGYGAGGSATFNFGDMSTCSENVNLGVTFSGGYPILGVPVGAQGSVNTDLKGNISTDFGMGLGLGFGVSVGPTQTIPLFKWQ